MVVVVARVRRAAATGKVPLITALADLERALAGEPSPPSPRVGVAAGRVTTVPLGLRSLANAQCDYQKLTRFLQTLVFEGLLPPHQAPGVELVSQGTPEAP